MPPSCSGSIIGSDAATGGEGIRINVPVSPGGAGDAYQGQYPQGTGGASVITVEARTMPATATMASITRWRSALVRATTRQSMSPVGDGVHFQHLGMPLLGHRVVAATCWDLQRHDLSR